MNSLQSTRLLAAVVAKNAVGSSWRKTLGTREWSRVPEDERHYVRSRALPLLLLDPSDRCAKVSILFGLTEALNTEWSKNDPERLCNGVVLCSLAVWRSSWRCSRPT